MCRMMDLETKAANRDDLGLTQPYREATTTPHEVPTVKKTGGASTGTTFTVHDVVKSDNKLPVGSAPAIVRERCGSVLPEAYSGFTYTTFEQTNSYEPLSNAFIMAVHTAFSQHYPLVFTPDAIWLCIMQGLSAHINSNADKLRHHFVEFEKEKKVKIRLSPSFTKGCSSNPWPEVFDLFSAGIKNHIGDKTHCLLTPEFSTTGPIERAAAQIVFMDCFKQYFCCQLMCICGIPSITLEGSVEDWKLLRERALALRQYELDWWIDELEPILDQFVAAASGNINKEFWIKIYKLERAYEAEMINGWILTLFPYLKDMKRNEYLTAWRTDKFFAKPNSELQLGSTSGSNAVTNVMSSSLASGVVSAPFKWISISNNETHNMMFFAGFMAATQDPDTLAIHPEIGWAVADSEEVQAAENWYKKYNMDSNLEFIAYRFLFQSKKEHFFEFS